MSARWAIAGARRWRHAGRASYAGTRRSKAGAPRYSRTRARRACGMLTRRMHGTSDTTGSRSRARSRARSIRRSARSTRSLRTGTFKDRLAALHSAQCLRRSCRSCVSRARSGLRHDHAFGWRPCNCRSAGGHCGLCAGCGLRNYAGTGRMRLFDARRRCGRDFGMRGWRMRGV